MHPVLCHKQQNRFVLIALLIVVLLAACSGTGSHLVTQAANSTATAEVAKTTATLPTTPTASPTPQSAILVVPEKADAGQAASVKAELQTLTAKSNIALVEKTSLSSDEVNSAVKVVVGLGPDFGIAALAKAAPGVQFVAVGIQGLQAGDNLTVIGTDTSPASAEAFVGGYIAGMLSYDWRAGMLAPANSDVGKASETAFGNGERFYCGLCRPLHPPYSSYPQTEEIADPTSKDSWKAAVNSLTSNDVDYVYVSPDVSSDDLLNYLYQAKVNIIGSQTPPSAVQSQWVGTILPDPGSALGTLWNDLLSGKGGTSVAMPMVVSDTTSGLLDPARQRLVDNILDELSAGLIDPNA